MAENLHIDLKEIHFEPPAGRTVSADQITAGAVDTNQLAADAVTADKIADDAVGEDQLADAAVTADQLAANAVTAAKLADDAVTADKINSAVELGVADDAVTTAKLADDAVTGPKIAPRAVDLEHLALGTVNTMLAFADGVPEPLDPDDIAGLTRSTIGPQRPAAPARGAVHLFAGRGPLRGLEDTARRFAYRTDYRMGRTLLGRTLEAIAADEGRLLVALYEGSGARQTIPSWPQYGYRRYRRFIELYTHDGVYQAAERIQIRAGQSVHPARGLAVTADRFFVLRFQLNRTNWIEVYTRPGGGQRSSEGVTLAATNRDPQGLVVTPTRFHVLDSGARKVFVYDRGRRTHLASEDWAPTAAGSNLRGIAFDGTRFFIYSNAPPEGVFVFDEKGQYQPKESFGGVISEHGLAVAGDRLFASTIEFGVQQHPLFKDGDILHYTDRWERFAMAAT